MKLSVVTGTRNRPDAIDRLIDSVIRLTSVDYELLVSDASDRPGTLASWSNRRLRIIEERPRLGHSRGYNAAFAQCRGDYILWLNDDAEVCRDYDVESIAFMEAHPQIGLGALHYSENGGPFHVNSAWGVPYANFGIFPRELGQKVGFFDERISMYGADNSFTFRILLSDHGIADIPRARVIHHSEKDLVRAKNQAGRSRDNQTLQNIYMPYRRAWTSAYHRHRVDTGTEAWSHGTRPRAMA